MTEILKFLQTVNWGPVVATLAPIGALLGFVIRNNVAMRNRMLQAKLENDHRAQTARNEREKQQREDQLKFEKLQDQIRLQMYEEREKTRSEMHTLTLKLSTAQESIVKLHEDLRASEKREAETRIRETMLLNEQSRSKEITDKLQNDVLELANKLETAQTTIKALQQENESLRADNHQLNEEIAKLKTGTHPVVNTETQTHSTTTSDTSVVSESIPE